MTPLRSSGLIAIFLAASLLSESVFADTGHDENEPKIVFDEAYREQVLREYLDAASDKHISIKKRSQVLPPVIQRPVTFASSASSLSTLRLASLASISAFTAPSGNGALMAASFAPFKPRVRYYWDSTTFYEESDNMPDNTMMPNLMVGISSWQQQVPLPAAYFANTTNPENSASSLGFGQPNYWRLPLVPTPSASPIAISSGNFQRGAVALASNGIAIFNPKNNTGRVSYEIGELDAYGGHCGLADDYHYHIIPTHLLSTFGGVLSNDKPVAWALDGYPIYGYVEPDGSARQALDTDGGHTHGSWGYHYHAIGTTTTDATHPYGTPQSPYLMNNFHGTVVNFGGQVDGQPEVGSIRASGTGGYTASPVGGASIVAFKNPVALTTDGSGHLIENVSGTPSSDCYLMRVAISGTNYDECWRINRNINPRTLTITWRLAGATTTTTYTPTAGTAAGNRLAAYTMGAWTQTKLPDTSQTQDTTATFGEDADYTINAQSFTDNGNGTVTDNVTGLMWQKVDNGESTWDNAVANASGVATGGYTDWRLPTPAELFSIFNHQNQNPALNTTFFPNNSAGAADYWWTSDTYGSSTTNVWCGNSGGGLGGKPKSETISAGGLFRYHARYVRGAKPSNLHSYTNNLDGTVTDTDTGLMWGQVPAASTTWDAALSYAENLALGGFTDWRLPNIKELQTLTDYTLSTATTAANIKPSINRTMFAKTLTNVTTNGTTTVTCADTTGLLVGMPIVDSSDVSSTYISNTTVPTVTSIPNGTTFVMSSAATGSGTGLTFKALPPPTAYWSSTSLRGDTTKAWLVETGINNSVLAANGPTRNSQGIISYEAKTSSYPVFVVRTTSVTNQIAVEQPSGTALTDGVSTVTYGSVNVGSTSTKTFVIRNNGSTTLSITGTSIDGTNSGLFTVTAAPAAAIAAGGSSSMTVQFNASSAGSKSAALHIASSDTGVGAAFDITLSGIGYVPPPTVTNVTSSPTVPSNTDTPYVTATVTPASGATISGVQLTYSTGAQVTGTAFQELFGNTTTTTGISGAMNAWTSVSTRAGGDLKLRGSTANHTAAIVLTNCTTNGTTAVTCASTTGLVVGMSISGTNIAAGTTIASVTNGTSFVLSSAATGSGTSLSLTAAGVTLTGCSLNTSPIIQCASTTGLVVGMGIAGAGLTTNPPNPTVLAITDATHFTVSSTVTAVPATLTATGCGLEFSNGTTNYTDTMATTTNAINSTTPTAGSVEFYVRTSDLTSNNGWAFQVSPDNGTTWNTRLSESFIANGATTCTLNNANDQTNGSTTILCSNTSGLTVGNTVQGAAVTIASCTTSTTTNPTVVLTANTTGLAIGMFVSGSGAAGIPNGARITAINSGVSFTMSASATVSATNTLLANYLNANTTISSINANVSFVVNNAAFYSGSGITLSSVNHGFALRHYDLVAADMSANMKLRFQMSGYNGVAPNRPPTVDVDDVIVSLTTGSAPVTVTMYDDGLHGDGVAGDGVYGAQLPAQSSGTTVSYAIAATDSNSSVTTLSSAGSYVTGPAPVISSNATLSNATPNVAYSSTLVASGGTGSTSAWTWSLVSGTLPSGLTLSSAGVISGTPTAQGTFNFSARVTDTAGRIATKSFALTVKTLPNIVIIVTDDQGWADVGYHTAAGQVPIQTPNMDAFGTTMAGSVRLERFYATTVCSVTRSTLMTGRNAIRHATNNERGLDISEHIMPQTFNAAGYQSYMVGKWHLGGSDKNESFTTVNGVNTRIIQEGLQYAPYNRGWLSHYGQYSGAIDYFTHRSAEPLSQDIPDWWLNGVQQDGPSEHTDSQGHGGWSPDLLADKAVSHIQNRDPNKPLLLYVAFNSIHGPVSAPADLLAKYSSISNVNRRTIAAAVDGMDAAMGRVLGALDTAGITNNTIVMWFGDNGGDETKGSLNDPLRGTKGDSYEGGMREVAGIRWPGVLPSNVISNQYVWVGDVFPTLCAAAGVTPQNSVTKPLDGVNMWPSLLAANSSATTATRGATLVTVSDTPIAIDKFTDPVNGGTKDFKLIRNHVGNTFPVELYNLTDDPTEATDLSANTSYTSIITTLTTAITNITPIDYPPYIGPPLITNTVAQGGTIELYAPFKSYKSPTVHWRKNGVNLTDGGTISGSTSATQVTDPTSALVTGAYTTKLVITGATTSDAGSYDVVISNVGGSTTSTAGALSIAPNAPTLAAEPLFTKATSQTVSWAAVSSATSYTVQMSGTADFASILSSQTVSTTSATFTGLTSGSTYYFRATASDGTTSSAFSNVVSSTQDAGNPVVTISTPANSSSTSASTITVTGTATDSLSGIASVSVNGVTATVTGNNWSASNVPHSVGANTITATATDNAQTGGNTGTASISVTLVPNAPVITNVATGPTAPTYLDPVWVTAQVQAPAGATTSQVQLTYSLGTPVSTTIFREVFNNTSSNAWNGTGSMNAWTTIGSGAIRQAVSTSNHTLPISLTDAATTNGSTTVTCASTSALWPGMLITGPNIPGSINGTATGNTTITSITNGTTLVLSQAASGTGSGLTLTAAGVSLTNATTTASSTGVTCDRTNGLVNGMSLGGTGLANNATVATVTGATTFTMNAAPATPGSALAITASGAAAEFNGGTANLTDTMFTTTNPINTTGTAGYIEFWVQTRDLAATNNGQWALQVSSDGGTTWNTRLSEDWTSETANLTNVVTNSTGSSSGSTTVTCASTTELTAGRSLFGPNTYFTGSINSGTATVAVTSTSTLAAGMFLQGGSGIPNNTRILTIDSATQFTMSANATATSASNAMVGTPFAPNATVSSITNGTTFVLSTPAYVNTSAAPTTAAATTVNHGFQLFHYDFAGAELGTNTKLRWQCTGYTPTAPTRSPRIDIDDILVATTAPAQPIVVTMFDDGLHGDGAAGDGVYGGQIPAQSGTTTVNFKVTATDSNQVSTTGPATGSYTYTVNAALTDATIKNAEFLGMPTDKSVTVNVVANTDQYAFIEYGTTPGKCTATTTPTLFTVDSAKPEFYNPIEITITGLQPDTEYYYRVRHRDTTAAFFNARGERSFHTARPRGTNFVFTVTADPHLDVNSDLPLFLRAMDNIAADTPDIHIDLGDIFMTDKMADGVTGIPPEFFGGVTPNQSRVNDRALFFRNQFERCCHSIPFFYTQGNHEAEYGYLFNAATDKQNNIPAWNLKTRKAFYPTPVPDAFYAGNGTPLDYTGGTLGLLENYYAYEWGDALFIALDPFWNTVANPNQTLDAWNWTLGKAQYDWLKATLQNSSAKYKFVFMHHIIGGSTTLADGTTPNIAARGGIEVADKYEWGGKNADGSEGFATKRPGWDMPIHQLLVQNKVNVVFHGHDHLYAYQTLDGMVYLECPQPGTANFTQLGSAGDGKYTQGVLLPNSGHIRVSVGPNQALAEYVRAYRTTDENASRHNRDISHSFAMAPRIFPPIEMTARTSNAASFRWNAIANKTYTVQYSTDLVNWTPIDSVTFTNTNTNASYTDTNLSRISGPKAFYRVSYTK